MILSLLVYDRQSDTYRLRDVTLTTLEDVEKLTGEATVLYGEADLTLDYKEGSMTWHHPGHSVAFNAVEQDGVLIPEDYDSLAMASIYYGMELSMLFFQQIGFDTAGFEIPTYYQPRFKIIDKDGTEESTDDTLVDNAFYMYIDTTSQAFIVLPFKQFQWVPLALNSGIISHEYAHAVFNALVADPARAAQIELNPPGQNFLLGLNEGCADYMAVTRTGDPDYMAHTAEKEVFEFQCNYGIWIELVRDASEPINYTPVHDRAARDLEPAEFCPYEIGGFFTSLMYEIAMELGQADNPDPATYQVAGWLLGALQDLGQGIKQDFELWDLLNLFVNRINTLGEKNSACTVIQERYKMYYAEVQSCT